MPDDEFLIEGTHARSHAHFLVQVSAVEERTASWFGASIPAMQKVRTIRVCIQGKRDISEGQHAPNIGTLSSLSHFVRCPQQNIIARKVPEQKRDSGRTQLLRV